MIVNFFCCRMFVVQVMLPCTVTLTSQLSNLYIVCLDRMPHYVIKIMRNVLLYQVQVSGMSLTLSTKLLPKHSSPTQRTHSGCCEPAQGPLKTQPQQLNIFSTEDLSQHGVAGIPAMCLDVRRFWHGKGQNCQLLASGGLRLHAQKNCKR